MINAIKKSRALIAIIWGFAAFMGKEPIVAAGLFVLAGLFAVADAIASND